MAQRRNGAKFGEWGNDGAIIVHFSLGALTLALAAVEVWNPGGGSDARTPFPTLWIPAFAGMTG